MQATYSCFPRLYLACAAVLNMDINNNQHASPGRKQGIRREKLKLHYQLKLLSWQRKYQTFNIPSLNLIHNTYLGLCVRKSPKIASVTCNLQHQLECAAETPPKGQQSERNICLWWNTGKKQHKKNVVVVVSGTFIMHLRALCSLWAEQEKYIKCPVIYILLTITYSAACNDNKGRSADSSEL